MIFFSWIHLHYFLKAAATQRINQHFATFNLERRGESVFVLQFHGGLHYGVVGAHYFFYDVVMEAKIE